MLSGEMARFELRTRFQWHGQNGLLYDGADVVHVATQCTVRIVTNLNPSRSAMAPVRSVILSKLMRGVTIPTMREFRGESLLQLSYAAYHCGASRAHARPSYRQSERTKHCVDWKTERLQSLSLRLYLAETAAHLNKWYDKNEVVSADLDLGAAAAVAWALRGDTGWRAASAWHMRGNRLASQRS